MAKEYNIEIPVIHEYDKVADKNICRIKITDTFYEILKLFVVKSGSVGYSKKTINEYGESEWKSSTRYKIKTMFAYHPDIKSLKDSEWILGSFFDTTLWDNEPFEEIRIEMSGLKEYYDWTGTQLPKFFEVALNTAAAMKVNITHTFVAKFRGDE